MKTMGDLWQWLKEVFGNFGGFQAMDFVIALVVSFRIVILVLGGRDMVEVRKERYN